MRQPRNWHAVNARWRKAGAMKDRRKPIDTLEEALKEVQQMRKVSGVEVKEQLLGLAGGDCIIVENEIWMSLEDSGFQMNSIETPDSGAVFFSREEVAGEFEDEKTYLVIFC